MKRVVLLIAALAVSGSAFAKEMNVKVPDAGWSIHFDSPPLSNPEEAKSGDDFAFKGNAGRFNLSLFVESPGAAGSSSKDCYEFYWPKARRNPYIDPDTVVVSETPKYVRVQYDMGVEFQGKSIRHRNVNYYFIFQAKWVDVHISVVDPRSEDEAIFAAFDKSLEYGE
ncbi:MAG: hypothetical protein ABJC13_06535 [Acidobacteriota bacterium]